MAESGCQEMFPRRSTRLWNASGRRWPLTPLASAPAQPGRDMLQDRLDDVGVVVDAELVRHGQQHCIGFRDGLVALELRNE